MGDLAAASGPAPRRARACSSRSRSPRSAHISRSRRPTAATRSRTVCRPLRVPGCDLIVAALPGEFGGWATAVRGLAVLPALAGLFVGAPLLAREFEQGTYRVAWTQAITRRRWLLSKTALLALATVVAGGLASAIVMWWREPFDALQGRMAPSGVRHRGARRARLRGLRAGGRRARGAAAPAHGGGDDGDARRLRRDPADRADRSCGRTSWRRATRRCCRPRPAARAGDWVLERHARRRGRQAGERGARRTWRSCTPSRRTSIPQTYLVTLGWKRIISYQPADRFWTFQIFEAGLFLALSVAIMALALWLVRRTPDADDRTSTAPTCCASASRRPPGSTLARRARTATTAFPQPHPDWRFVFVNHALTNPFFVPAKYGSAGRRVAARGAGRVDRLGQQQHRRDGARRWSGRSTSAWAGSPSR